MINLKSLAATAFATGASLTPDAFKAVTVKSGLQNDVDPETDQATTTWLSQRVVQGLGYSDEKEQKAMGPETELRSWLLQVDELGPDGIDPQSQIDEGGKIWEVYRVEPDPSGTIVIARTKAT